MWLLLNIHMNETQLGEMRQKGDHSKYMNIKKTLWIKIIMCKKLFKVFKKYENLRVQHSK